MTPRVLFVGRTRYRLPLSPSLARKWDAISELMNVRILASGVGSDPRFALVPPRRGDGPRFYLGLVPRVAMELRTFRPEVVVAESPYEGAAVELARRLTRSQARIVVEVHGDWHGSTRLYGARTRALLAPLGDRLAALALRRADALRAVSGSTAALIRGEGREPLAVFHAYVDLDLFSGPTTPVPPEPEAVFIGSLERTKDIEGLARAWRILTGRMPQAGLTVVGSGTQAAIAEALARDGVRWERELPPQGVLAVLERSRALVISSRSEGLPRVVIEALLRGRAVVATRVGGIPDLVEDGLNGLLVEPGDPEALASALERILGERGLAERLGSAARESAEAWMLTPEGYARRVWELVEAVSRSDSVAASKPPGEEPERAADRGAADLPAGGSGSADPAELD